MDSTSALLQSTAGLLAQATQDLQDAISVSDREREEYRHQIQKLEAELAKATKDRDEAVRETTILREKQSKHEEQLKKAEDNRLEHIRKLKASLAAERAAEIEKMKLGFAKERAEFQKTIDVPKQLRQEIERLKVENKALQKKGEGTKTMTQEIKSIKQELDAAQKSLTKTSQQLQVATRDLNKERQKSKEIDTKSSTIEKDYFSMFEKVTGLETDLASLKLQYETLESREEAQRRLVEVGLRIRQRYMCKEGGQTGPYHIVSPFIQDGNTAAHEKDAEADLAVFTAGDWDENRYGHMFGNIYGATPEVYRTALSNWKRFLDAEELYNTMQQEDSPSWRRAIALHDLLVDNGIVDEVVRPLWKEAGSLCLDQFERLLNDLSGEDESTYDRDTNSDDDGGCSNYSR